MHWFFRDYYFSHNFALQFHKDAEKMILPISIVVQVLSKNFWYGDGFKNKGKDRAVFWMDLPDIYRLLFFFQTKTIIILFYFGHVQIIRNLRQLLIVIRLSFVL